MFNKKFTKKYLHKPKDLFNQIKKIKQSRKRIKNISKENKISPQFAEKIMLAVTGVNKCVYCSYRHTTTALKKNVDKEEIEKILTGDFETISEYESKALLYAQHWTEKEGSPEPDVRNEIINFYGKEKTEYIEFYMQIVNTGNLISNTVEAYKKGIKSEEGKVTRFITYLLCLPIAFSIKTTGSKEKKFVDTIRTGKY